MTRSDIIRMAREADIIDFRDADDDPHTAQMVEFLERFAALVAAAEREAIMHMTTKAHAVDDHCDIVLAADIRARSKP